jgi:phosphatidylethanolamine-binding protein (PEBP) family uncharacterized protein
MMTTASRLAWGLIVLAAANIVGCSSGDDDSTGSGGTGGSGGTSGSGGMGAAAGASGMACVGDPPVTDHNSCTGIASLKKGDDTFVISSTDFTNCEELPTANTCDGNAFGTGSSPALAWTGVPAGTMSFAIVFKDISLLNDATPNNAHGYHWAMWDIPATVTSLPAGMMGGDGNYHPAAVPMASQWSNLKYGFFPPCPNPFPRDNAMFTCSLVRDSYSFTLYALPMASISDNLPAPTLDPTTNMPTGNYVVNVGQYIEGLNAIAVTEVRATSKAWASSFTPPSGQEYPCTKDMISGGMTTGCLQ